MTWVRRPLLFHRRAALTIPQQLTSETIAIVRATAPDLRARKAAITLRAWHHLGDDPAQRLLFEEFAVDGELMGLLDAVMTTVERGRWSGTVPRALVAMPPAERAAFNAPLECAFVLALEDVLDGEATRMVREAWRQGFRFFMRQLGCQG